VHAFGSESEEAHWIVSQLSQEENRDSVVVLARNRSIVERIARVAQDTGVRAAIPVTRYEFESAPLSMLHSMLRLANTSDSIKAINRLCGAFFQMTGRQVDPKELRSRAVADEENPLTVFFSLLMPIAATAEFKQLGEVVTNELVEHRYFRNVSTHFFKWVDRIGSKTDWARSAYLASYDDERAVWEEFERLHRGLVSENVALSEFLRALDLASKAPVEQDVIRLLTVHGAKGLEFERVYIAGASDGQFPAFQAVKLGASSDAMEEERRSFFVAITRSSDEVLISYSSIVRGFVSEPSRFLREMKVL
jgi:DNA helicase-2/ATP-dependent DNA helicase PcrA